MFFLSRKTEKQEFFLSLISDTIEAERVTPANGMNSKCGGKVFGIYGRIQECLETFLLVSFHFIPFFWFGGGRDMMDLGV